MKRGSSIIAIFLVLVMIFSACGKTETAAETSTGGGAEEAAATEAGKVQEIGELEENYSGDAETNVLSDETLRVILDEEPSSMAPQYSIPSSPGMTVGGCIFDRLFRWNPETKEADPCLATDYEWVDDTHLRLTLRDGVIAHDGTVMTAEDVLYTIEYGQSGTNTMWATYFDLEGTVVEDDLHIVLALNKAVPTMVDQLTGPSYGIVDKSSVEAAGGIEASAKAATIGYGPYTFDSWVPGQYIRLVRHDDYWDADNVAYYKYIDFTWNADSSTRSMAIQSGDGDVTFNLSAMQLNNLSAVDGVSVYGTSADAVLCMYINCSAEPLDNELVRDAIDLALDRETLVQLCYGGLVEPCETSISPVNKYYSAPDNPSSCNIEAAKQLLAEAGYPDGIDIDMMFIQKNTSVAQMVQSQLEQAGIRLSIVQTEFIAMMGTVCSGDYQIYMTDISSDDMATLITRLDGRLSTQEAVGGCQFNDDGLNALIDIASYDLDEDERREALAGIQDFVREHHPLVGICCEIKSTAFRSDLVGVSFDVANFPDVSRVRPR
ncbi:MAG: ABC transporter substrate-binding protein [Oscillospiraceae bacterium]|jgi:peptide/nickel transport system substrate-binding protein